MFAVLVSQSCKQGAGTPISSRAINGRGLWSWSVHCSETVTDKLVKAGGLKGKLLIYNIHTYIQLVIFIPKYCSTAVGFHCYCDCKVLWKGIKSFFAPRANFSGLQPSIEHIFIRQWYEPRASSMFCKKRSKEIFNFLHFKF